MNYEILTIIGEELKQKLVRSHITNVVLLNSTTIVLTSSYLKDDKILISLESLNPYIYFVKAKDVPLTINNGLSKMLRHYIKDSYIFDISVENKDSIIKFSLRIKVEENVYEDYYMYIELIKKQAKVIITKSNNIVVLSTHYSNKEDTRKVLINEPYLFPENSLEFVNKYDVEKYKNEANKIYNQALKKRIKEKYSPLLHHIDNKYKQLTKKVNVLEEEIKIGDELKSLKDYGDYCLYMSKEEVYELLNEAGIKYDYELSLVELSTHFYKGYKKGKAKIIAANEQMEKCLEELQYYKYLKDVIGTYEEEELDSLTFTLLKSKNETRKNEKIKKAKDPYKLCALGTEFYFGKNAEQNHNLTFHKSNDNDTFVHIHNYPGSHIIIKNPNPTNEQLLFASSMALILSNKTSGEVDIAKIKDVKSTTTTGLVLLKKSTRIKLNDVDNKVKKLLSTAKK